MPKKFVGENSKATATRLRKENAKIEERKKDAAAKEDAYWTDDNKQAQRKFQRKVFIILQYYLNNIFKII